MTATRRIGIFGGTFDPVHDAHVALAKLALDELSLDELRWIPTGQSWQKTRDVTPVEHREAMVRIAMGDAPRFVFDRREIERAGPSYTLDTVRELQAEQPGAQWFLIIGQDQYAGLHTWRGWPELLARVNLAVANRPGGVPQPDAQVQRAGHAVVPLPMMDISSTAIRARVAAGQGIADLVPAGVARYIDQHRLYRGGNRN